MSVPSCNEDRKVLFIVLSFNGYEDTAQCLESLCPSLPTSAAILVIDNASSPPVLPALQARFPDVEIIGLPTNTGWAGGNNAGIALGLARGFEWLCLLNNDTVFPKGEVVAWCETLAQSPPALMHPSIYYWDEPEVAQLCPTARADVTDWCGYIRMNYAYGACLGVHRSIFEQIGTFDERLFLQLEETDFYHRATDAGYVSACDPTVKIFHKESRAFGGKQTAGKLYYTTRNTLLVIEKRRESTAAKIALLRDLYWSITHVAASHGLPDGPGALARWLCTKSPYAVATRAGIADYVRRRFGRMSDRLSDALKPRPVAVAETKGNILDA
jgi:GT2 family glycosyltransferase